LRKLAKYAQVQAIGYEYSLIPYTIAVILNLFSKTKIKLNLGNFFQADLSQADYIFCYLITDEMKRLEEKLYEELKPGAIIISNTFRFKNWQPQKVIIVDEKKKKGTLSNKIYIYKKE